MHGSTPVVDRVSTRSSHASLYASLGTTAFLALAILKPWGSPSPTPQPPLPPGAQVAVAANAQPSALDTPAPPSAGPGQIVCAPAGWQIVTLDRMADWTVRTWIPAAPVAASGPQDPSIPTLRLESPEVRSIGVCGSSGAPAGDAADAVAMMVVAAWSTDTAVAAPGGLHVLELATAQGAHLDPRLARLYAPIRGGTIAATWPMGRFVLELAPLAADTTAPDAGRGPLRWYVAIAVPGVAR